MKVGNLISLALKCKGAGKVGLIVQVPYGLPTCARVFWINEGKLGVCMQGNMELISEAG